MNGAAHYFGIGEKALAITAMGLMAVLPVAELITRQAGMNGIPGSTVFVQHLTLWVAFLGAAMAANSDRLLALSANTFLPEKWAAPVRVFASGMTAAIAASLCYASYEFVVSQREGGTILALGIAKWVAQTVMPAGFLLIALRAIRGAGPRLVHRAAASLFLLSPLGLYYARPGAPVVMWITRFPGRSSCGGPGGDPTDLRHARRHRADALLECCSACSLCAGGDLPAKLVALSGAALSAIVHAGGLSVGGRRRRGAAAARVYGAIRLAAGRPRDHYRRRVRHLHLGRFRRHDSLHGRIVAAYAREGSLSPAVLHRADQRLGLPRAALSPKLAGDSVRSLFPDGHHHAVCSRLPARTDDGGRWYRAGASCRLYEAALIAPGSPFPKPAERCGRPSGNSPFRSSC